jgi:hypothetical protein
LQVACCWPQGRGFALSTKPQQEITVQNMSRGTPRMSTSSRELQFGRDSTP